MEKKRESRRKEYAIPVLFVVAVGLVFTFSAISLITRRNGPSVKDGATTYEVEEYAYKLLETDNGTSAAGYNEAVDYYNTQIAEAANEEQALSLRLDLAVFLGKTGDPVLGVQTISDIDADELSLDARYYLYSTYIYLYGREGDDDLVAAYRQRIIDEGL